MKKFLAFLALLVCVLSAPQLANAWNDPGNLYFFKDLGQNNGSGSSTQFSHSGNVYTYTVDATAGDVLGVIIDQNVNNWDGAHSSNTYLPTGYKPSNDEDYYSVSGDETWPDLRVYGATWSKYCLKFGSGKKYTVTITYNNGRIDGAIKASSEPVTPVDYSKNTNPTNLRFKELNSEAAEGDFTYTNSADGYNWYYDFTYNGDDSCIDFNITATFSDGTTKTYGNNTGNGSLNTWTEDAAAVVNPNKYYQGGLTKDKKYRIEVRAHSGNAAQYDWRIVEYTEPVAKHYISYIDLICRENENNVVAHITEFSGDNYYINAPFYVNKGADQDETTRYYLRATFDDESQKWYSVDGNDNNTYAENEQWFFGSGNRMDLKPFADGKTPSFCFDDVNYITSFHVYPNADKTGLEGVMFIGEKRGEVTTYDPIYVNGFWGDWTSQGKTIEWNADEQAYVFDITVSNDNAEFGVSTTHGDSWGKYHSGRYKADNDNAALQGGDNRSLVHDGKDGVSMYVKEAGKYTIKITRKSAGTDGLDKIEVTRIGGPVASGLNFNPKAVREADGDWSVITGKQFAFVKANYLNNNRLQPDWEMTPVGDDFVIENVTLRNLGVISVVIYSYDGDKINEVKTVKGDPAADFDASDELQYGKPFNIKCNVASNSLEFTKLSDIPPFIAMVGYNFRQNKKEDTPANSYDKIKSNTDTGWQESWVLYGPQGEPMRDNDGKLMFSTQWPPVNPIYFKAVKLNDNVVTDSMEMSSENLTFHPTYDSKPMTRAEWKTTLNTNGNYDNLWEKSNLKKKNDTDFKIVDSDDYDNHDTQKYVRYVINNMWILGSTKLWTGWTGGSKDGVANWSPYMNWGVYNNDEKGNNDSGYVIQENRTYTLKEDYSNFLFSNPTYFKTVELFLPVNEDGSVDLTHKMYGARFYTTPAVGDAYIRAQSHQNRCGKYVLGYDLSKFTNGSNAKVVSWTVTRYDATESDMTSISPADWTPVGTHSDAKDFVVSQGGEITNNESNGIKFNTYNQSTGDILSWNITDKNLDNGRYFYGLHIVFELNGKTVEDDVMSNVFTVANYNFEPVCVPLQLIRLNIPADDELVKDYAQYNGKYLTYRPARTGRYYIVDPETEQAVTLDADEANDMIKTIRQYPRYYTWTAKYYVAAFDGNNYASVMRQAALTGEIEAGYSERPDVYIAKVDGENGSFTAADSYKAVRSTANKLYGRVFDAEGSLEQQYYQAQMGYSFTPTGEAQVTKAPETNTLNNSIIPVVPKPYGFRYAYKFDTDIPTDGAAHVPMTKEFVTKSDLNNGAECKVKVLDSDFENLKARNCRAHIYFKQPNVDADILKKYNIYYDVTVTNTHSKQLAENEKCEHNITMNGLYYDPSQESLDESHEYDFLLKNVYPDDTHQPILTVNSVDYRSVAGNGDVDHLIATYPSVEDMSTDNWANQTYRNQTIQADNVFAQGRGRKLGKLHIGLENSPLLVAHVQFRGHEDMSVDEEDGITAPGGDIIDNQDRLVPNFYHIETKWNGRHATHVSEDAPLDEANFGDWTQNTRYYSVPTLWNHTAADNDRDFKKGYYYNTVLYPMVPMNVTETELKENLTVRLTPLYLFWRNPVLPTDTEVKGLKAESNTVNAPAKVSSSTTAAEGQYVILRGAPAEVNAANNNFGATTGIENVLIDNEGEAQYYNIQGMRILNPVEGQIYVVRRGATVTKELYK